METTEVTLFFTTKDETRNHFLGDMKWKAKGSLKKLSLGNIKKHIYDRTQTKNNL